MSNYTKATNFTTKDTLSSGDPNKIVKGTELDTEYIAISAAISSKADLASPAFTGVPTTPTATSTTNTAQIASTAFVQTAIASALTGIIAMWSGTIATIPTGWVLCDGTNSTPDLRDKFIIGASADNGGAAKTNITGSYTQTGGTKDAIVVSHSHTATSTDSGHLHGQTWLGADDFIVGSLDAGAVRNPDNDRYGSFNNNTNIGNANITTTVASTGSSGTNQNLPPYYALAFIMKTA